MPYCTADGDITEQAPVALGPIVILTLCLWVLYTIHGDICSVKNEKVNKLLGFPRMHLHLLGSWPHYVRASSNEWKAIPSGRPPDMVFVPSLLRPFPVYYVRLYKYFD